MDLVKDQGGFYFCGGGRVRDGDWPVKVKYDELFLGRGH